MKAPNKNFCIAPWVHTYTSPQTERRLCCASREDSTYIQQYIDTPGESKIEYQPISLEEHWNSEPMKSVRRRMISGEKLSECDVCQDQILSLHTYRSYFTDNLFPHLIEDALESTDETGYTTMEPISFDYRLSNHCNFKCRMCGEQLSSAWETEKRKYDEWDPKAEPWMIPENRKVIQTFQESQVLSELEAVVDNKTIREMYWVGGEPLMWPDHWRLMEKMVDNGVAKEVLVRYNTNLSRIDWKGKNLYDDYLIHFKDSNICASLDGIGRVGEWIRTGLDWNSWDQNFRRGIKFRDDNSFRHDYIVLDLTLTLPGLLHIRDFIDYANELNSKVYTKIIFAFDPSVVLSPFALPRDIFNKVLDKALWHAKEAGSVNTISIKETLEAMKDRPVFEEEFPDTYREAFKNNRDYQNRQAIRRGDGENGKMTLEEIYAINKDVLNWWTQ